MKKKFIRPTMDIVKIETQQFIASSLGLNPSDASPADADARELEELLDLQ